MVPKNSYEDVKLYVKLDNGAILASNSKGATQIVEVEESFWEELGNKFAKIRRIFSR